MCCITSVSPTRKPTRPLLQGGGTDVLIVENSPQPLNSKADLPASWHYVSFPDNPGLGAAYNYTADFARRHGYDWILLTDQDTAFPPGILEQYRSAVERHPSVKLFCPQVSIGPDRFMSPVPMNRYRCRIQPTAPTGEISLSAYSVINSGMLIHVETFIQAGGYRPEVHLDFADFQFIERFRKVSPKAFVIDAVCQQEFSNEVQTREQKLSRYRLFCQSLRNFVCDDCKNQNISTGSCSDALVRWLYPKKRSGLSVFSTQIIGYDFRLHGHLQR